MANKAAELATLEYKEFRKTYRQLIRSARKSMDTPLQRNLVEAVAGTAFQAGFAAGRSAPPKKLKLHPWTKTFPTKADFPRHD